MNHIDQLAYSSKLRSKDPMVKVIFTLLTLGVCIWANTIYISVVILIMMSVILVIRGGTHPAAILKMLLIPGGFLLLGVCTVAIQISPHPQSLTVSGGIPGLYWGLSEEGIITALALFFKGLGAVSCLYFLTLSTPLTDILAVLKKVKCPPLLVELISLIYRYIFVFTDIAHTIYTAQTSRLGYRGIAAGYRSMAVLVSTLFIRSIQRSNALYTALESRGYSGEFSVLEEKFTRSWFDYTKAVGVNLMLVVTVLLVG